MTYTITKEFKFDAAHRLVRGYIGKCSNIHGHSWVAKVAVEANELDQYDFVVDFSAMKTIQHWIDENLDHAMIVSQNDTPMIQFLHEGKQKRYIIGDNPTSEAISKVIYNVADDQGFNVKWVEISETCTSSCRYEPETE